MNLRVNRNRFTATLPVLFSTGYEETGKEIIRSLKNRL